MKVVKRLTRLYFRTHVVYSICACDDDEIVKNGKFVYWALVVVPITDNALYMCITIGYIIITQIKTTASLCLQVDSLNLLINGKVFT